MKDIALETGFVAALLYAFVFDIKSLRIPNSVSIFLVALFLVDVAVSLQVEIIIPHFATGLILFAITFAFYLKGAMGAGDVKLISAVAVWTGPQYVLPFLAIMTLIGGGLALSLILIREGLKLKPRLGAYTPHRVQAWARKGVMPYGAAIAAAALAVAPYLFRSASR